VSCDISSIYKAVAKELSQTYKMNVKKWSEGPFINA